MLDGLGDGLCFDYVYEGCVVGGVVIFYDRLIGLLCVVVEDGLNIDFVCCMLWGYSFGGFFMFYVLLVWLLVFVCYVVISFLIWWDELLMWCVVVKVVWVDLLLLMVLGDREKCLGSDGLLFDGFVFVIM